MAVSPLPSRVFQCKPDFDECIARIYAWYEQRILDRPPVRFHHHNVEYERHRSVEGPWATAEDRWLDVEFQIRTFVESLQKTEFLGETFPVFWPNLSAVVYNLVLMPMGAVIFVDHYLMKRLGMVEFYAERTGRRFHWPPVAAWVLSLLMCVAMWYFLGIQEYFLCLPGWLLAGLIYLVTSKITQRPINVSEEMP